MHMLKIRYRRIIINKLITYMKQYFLEKLAVPMSHGYGNFGKLAHAAWAWHARHAHAA
jgi:hypothetical protein